MRIAAERCGAFRARRQSSTIAACVLLGALCWSAATRATEIELREAMFEWFWDIAASRFCDSEKAQEFFTPASRDALRDRVLQSKDESEAIATVRAFLRSLQTSHTNLYVPADIEYQLLDSLFQSREISSPKVFHVGAQYSQSPAGHVVRAVLEGYPLAQSGIRRGDVITQSDGTASGPLDSFRSGEAATLRVLRADSSFSVTVTPVHESVHASYMHAMTNSVRVIQVGNRRVGYVHLWTGTDDAILTRFVGIVSAQLATTDGIILDLRDGHGGAWHRYLDPFFENRDDYFVTTIIGRDGKATRIDPEAHANPVPYKRPMVVIINEGTRSGKEALAFQFKKSSRAKLVGATTAGAFSGGAAFFKNFADKRYVLYLAVNTLFLDETRIEAIGVAPEVEVAYPIEANLDHDPQFDRALDEIRSMLTD